MTIGPKDPAILHDSDFDMPKKKKQQNDSRWIEILGVSIMMVAILVFIGLISYHQGDYPNSGSRDLVRNWGGEAGAFIAYYLHVFTIGYVCLIVPFIIFLFGWTLFVQRPFGPFIRFSFYVLMLGLFLSTALAMPEAVSEEGSRFGIRLSGLLGLFIARHLHRFLGTVGSFIVLLTFLIMFLISATSWSMRESVLGLREGMRSFWAEKFRNRPKPGNSRTVHEKPAIRRPPLDGIPIHQDEMMRSPHVDPEPKPEPPTSFPPRPVQPSEPTRKTPAAPSVASVQHAADSAPAPQGDAYRMPSIDLLRPPSPESRIIDKANLERKAHFLEEKLLEFGVQGTVIGIRPGPIITRFEVSPAPGVKVNKFINVQEDLALVMKATRVRIVAPIPGKAAVGIEIPNEAPQMVMLSAVIGSGSFQNNDAPLPIALGQTIEGKPYTVDLSAMPHLLVAGSTGSGKSVCLNTIITSLLYGRKPSEVKLVLIDPKKLELNLYKKLRHHHLITRENLSEEVITTVDNTVSVLKSLEAEMERRYRIMARVGVRNIEQYNESAAGRMIETESGEKELEKFPYIVLVVDELADLMMLGAREVEEPIARLAQMSRAVGIHLILATQRPSVDVITGVIKANFPSRIAFQVAAKTDSRTILDRNGAEKLLGKGDMLFLNSREPEPIRIHGAFITTDEVQKVVAHIAAQPREEKYFLKDLSMSQIGSGATGAAPAQRDELFWEAAKLVVRHNQGSASLLQRRLRVGYARAGRLIDELEEMGIIGPFEGSKSREVLVDELYIEQLYDAEMSQNPSEDI